MIFEGRTKSGQMDQQPQNMTLLMQAKTVFNNKM